MTANILSSVKSISTYFSASLIPLVISLAANPLIALNMSPEDYAVTGYYTSFSNLLTPIILFYVLQYYIKRYFEYDDINRLKLRATIFKFLISFSFAVSILCCIALYSYIKLGNSNIQFSIFPYLPLAVFTIPLTGLYSLELADFKMGKNSKSYFKLSTSHGILTTLAILFFVVVLKMGALGKLIAPLIINASFFVYLFIKNKDLLKIKVEFEHYKTMLLFCLPLALGAMLGYFTNGFDKTYMESYGDITEYGYYIVGSSIASYLHVFSTAISSTFQPDIYESIIKHNNRKMFKIFAIQVGLLMGVVAVFILLCPIIINILTAGRYVDSTPYARIISISTITSTIYYNLNCYTIAKGFPRLYLYTSVIGSILIVFFLPIFANNWGFIGASYMVGFSFILFFVVNTILLSGKLYFQHKRALINKS